MKPLSLPIWRKPIIIFQLLLLFSFSELAFSQEHNKSSNTNSRISSNGMNNFINYSPNHITALGDTLYTFKLRSDNNLGVTIVRDTIYVSCAGSSSTMTTDNYFYRYNLNGTFIDSLPQHQSAQGWGYRDLAFDGTYILGSEDTQIKKFRLSDMNVVQTITNSINTIHRGLAYNPDDNVIWSSNFTQGPIAKLNATTGATIKSYGKPITAPFGLAHDKFSKPGRMAIWLAEPSDNTAFRLSRLDTASGLIDYTLDISSKIPTGAISGGLEIINNHPSYPNKIIAVVLVQLTGDDILAFVELNNAPEQTNYTYELQNNFQLGGFINNAAVQGNNLFLCQGNTLSIFDYSGTTLQKLSWLDFPGELTNIFLVGNLAYIGYGTDTAKFEVVNISNPSSPAKLTTTPLKFTGIMYNIFVSGNYAYISLGSNSFSIVNISNPANPTIVNTPSEGANDIFVKGNYAYIAGSNKFSIYDISNPSSPVPKSNIILGGTKNIFVYGNYAYLSGGVTASDSAGMWIINITDPMNPSIAGSFGKTGNRMKIGKVHTNGNYAYFVNDSTNFISLNISDPNNPVIVGSLNKAGKEIYSIDSTAKLAFGTVDDYFKVINFATPSSPSVQKSLEFLFSLMPNSISTTGDKLWVCGNEKLIRYQISTNSGLVFEKSYPDFKNAKKIIVNGNYGYLSYANNDTLFVIDFTNSNSPVVVAKFKAAGFISEFTIRGNYLYLTNFTNDKLEILNITDPSTPARMSELFIDGKVKDIYAPTTSSTTVTNSNHLYLAYYKNSFTYGFKIIDVTNPASPSILYSYDFVTTHPIGIRVYSNVLFVLMLDESRLNWYLTVYNISNPASPSLLKSISGTKSRAWGLDITNEGLITFSLPDSNLIKVYKYNIPLKNFEFVKDISVQSPTQIVRYSYTPAKMDDYIDQLVEQYVALTGYASYGLTNEKYTSGSKGNYGVKLITKKPPLGQVFLDMVIWPPTAANEGCTTSPAPGQHQYAVNTVVPLIATANATLGWNFKEWTGGAGGTSPSTMITMDQNKTAVANFVKPLLTIQEFSSQKCNCPEEYNKRVMVAQGMLVANEISDWTINQIRFQGLGNCNEAVDFDTVVFKIPGREFASKYADDNGYVYFNFSPALVVPKGSFIGWTLNYALSDSLYHAKCPMDTIREFGIRIRPVDVTAIPTDYPNGQKVGDRTSQFYQIACVFNIPKSLAFSKIQSAVQSTETTNGDSIVVCPGSYKENIEIRKAISVNSKSGPDVTFLRPDGYGASVRIDQHNVSVRGFGFKNLDILYPLVMGSGNNLTIENCKFDNIKIKPNGSVMIISFGNKVLFKDIQMTTISSPESQWRTFASGLSITRSNDVKIENCNFIDIQGRAVEGTVLDSILIKNSQFMGNWHGLYIEDSKHITIDGGYFIRNGADPFERTNTSNAIHIVNSKIGEIKNCQAIFQNGNYGILLQKVESFKIRDIPKINYHKIYGIYLDTTVNVFIYKCDFIHSGWSGITIDESEFAEVRECSLDGNKSADDIRNTGIVLYKSTYSKLAANKIFNFGTAIFLRESKENSIDFCNLYDNNYAGIDIYASSNNVFLENMIYNNRSKTLNEGYGVLLTNKSNKNLFEKNYFYNHLLTHRRPQFLGDAISIRDSSNDNDFKNNSIGINGTGISLYNTQNNRIVDNHIYKNAYAGIFSKSSKFFCYSNRFSENGTNEIYLKNLDPLNIVSSHTGIHLDSSSADISNNLITSDEENGIFLENGSTGNITQNNIQGNKKYGLLNSDNLNVNAQNNYWGDPTGPSGIGPGQGDKVGGNVNFSNWRTQPIGVVIYIDKDTTFTRAGKSDSLSIGLNNLRKLNDTLLISISDSLSWSTNPLNQEVVLKDSAGYNLKLIYNVPINTPSNTINRVKIIVKSKADTSNKESKTFYLRVYQQLLTRVAIDPVSIILGQGHYYTFKFFGYDQYGEAMSFTPKWSATGGTIDSVGKYTAGNDTGSYFVKVKDSTTLEAVASVKIISSAPKLTTLQINPDRIVMFPNTVEPIDYIAQDQFGNDMLITYYLTATGGTIDSLKRYVAGSDTGKFLITLRDSATNKQATADVIIVPNTITPIYPKPNSENIPVTSTMKWYEYPRGVKTYIYISTDSTFNSINIKDSISMINYYDVENLQNNVFYYWKIIIKTIDDSTVYSSVWKFKTKPLVNQNIILPAGWSMISSFVDLLNPDLDTLCAKIKSKMVVLKNGSGQVYWPSLGIDQLTNWRKRQGFQIYMNSPDTLKFYGNEISPEKLFISLTKGWNISSYSRNSAMNIDSALSQIKDNIFIVKNNLGQVYIPQYGINQIGNLQTGQGYQIYSKTDQLFTYPQNLTLYLKTTNDLQNELLIRNNISKYKPLVFNTGNNSVILIESQGLSDGDEIGIYDNKNILIGSGICENHKAVITIWGDNMMTNNIIEGAEEGKELTIKIWSKSLDKESIVEPEQIVDVLNDAILNNQLVYRSESFYLVKINVNLNIPETYSLSQNYPNPFNPITTIKYTIPEDSKVRLEVYDILGQRVEVLVDEIQKAGYYKVNFGKPVYSSGVYIYRLVARDGKFVQSKKMLMIK